MFLIAPSPLSVYGDTLKQNTSTHAHRHTLTGIYIHTQMHTPNLKNYKGASGSQIFLPNIKYQNLRYVVIMIGLFFCCCCFTASRIATRESLTAEICWEKNDENIKVHNHHEAKQWNISE